MFAGTPWLGFAPKRFALVNAGLIVIRLVLAVAMGRGFKQMSGTA